MRAIQLLTCLSMFFCRSLFAEESVEAVESAPAPAVAEPTFVVILPERVDDVWYWYYASEQSQHLAQSAVEKEMIKAGLNVVDAATLQGQLRDGTDLESLTGLKGALDMARSTGATYLITGQATASKASQGSAYGVTVVRSNAEVTAKVVRVSDARVLFVQDASALEGGEASRTAGQQAIKKAAKTLAKDLAYVCKGLPGVVPAP